MSHFYGKVHGTRGPATRCGSKASGLEVTAAGWGGAVEVRVWHDNGVDRYSVAQKPWQGNGVRMTLAEGVLGRRETDETCHGYVLNGNACPACGKQVEKP